MKIEIRAQDHSMSPIETDAIRRTIASAMRHHACERVRVRLVRRRASRAGRGAWACHAELASGRPDEGLVHVMGIGGSKSASVHDACAAAERAMVASRIGATRGDRIEAEAA